MILSVEQIKAVRHGAPVSVSVDGTECVVIRKDEYDKITQGALDDVDVREAYPLMDAVARQDGWDDPSEDLYDDLVPPKS